MFFISCNKVGSIPFLLDIHNKKILIFELPNNLLDSICLLEKTNQFHFIDKNGKVYERFSIFYKSNISDSSINKLFYSPFINENNMYCISLDFALNKHKLKNMDFSIEYNTNIDYKEIQDAKELLFYLKNQIDTSVIEKVLWNTKKGPIKYWLKNDKKEYLIK